MKQLSVVIVTYNSEENIYDCLESLFKYNDIGDDLEVIIVDNCSLEYELMNNTISAKWGDRVCVMQNTHNGGYGQGNNVGIRASAAPVIMIMNPDVRLNMPIFSTVLSEFYSNQDILLYGVKQLSAKGKRAKSFGWNTRSCPYVTEPLRYICTKLDLYVPRYMFLNGSCFFLRKDAFERVGLFDENIFMYNEEEDIHYRLSFVNGHKFIYNNKLTCVHLHPAVSDYSKEGYGWLRNNLKSLLYLDARDGINAKKTIQRAIQRANMSIIRSFNNPERKKYFQGWKKILQEYI